MKLDVKFSESNQSFNSQFGSVQNISDGGYERGYAAGYTEGLAARQHETWTITYADGTVEEKEVALL